MSELPASCCDRCGHLSCPPVIHCPEGCGPRMQEAHLPAIGVLYSSTIVRVPHSEFGAPYQIAYVDLDKGPRVLGQVDGDRVAEIDARMTVELDLQPDQHVGRRVRFTFTAIVTQEGS